MARGRLFLPDLHEGSERRNRSSCDKGRSGGRNRCQTALGSLNAVIAFRMRASRKRPRHIIVLRSLGTILAFRRDASSQTGLCAPRLGAGQTKAQSGTSQPLRARPATHLSKALLRFQRMDRTQTHRETPLHASQSGAARIGGVPGTMALKQFPRVCPRRSWSGKSKRVGSAQDEDSTTPVLFRSTFKDKPALCFRSMTWATRHQPVVS